MFYYFDEKTKTIVSSTESPIASDSITILTPLEYKIGLLLSDNNASDIVQAVKFLNYLFNPIESNEVLPWVLLPNDSKLLDTIIEYLAKTEKTFFAAWMLKEFKNLATNDAIQTAKNLKK